MNNIALHNPKRKDRINKKLRVGKYAEIGIDFEIYRLIDLGKSSDDCLDEVIDLFERNGMYTVCFTTEKDNYVYSNGVVYKLNDRKSDIVQCTEQTVQWLAQELQKLGAKVKSMKLCDLNYPDNLV